MASWTISRQELCFAILVESHSIVSAPLFEVVLNAVKARNPADWEETVYTCFGASVRTYVRQHLENNLPVTDIYAVCRIIRRRINDIASCCGGSLLNPHEKERFSLAMQGAETARHWTFHGEQCVSPGEVCSNIVALRSVIATLSANCQRTSLNLVAHQLTELLEYAKSLECACRYPRRKYMLRKSSIGSALLYSAFKEFERRYKEFIRELDGTACSFNMAQARAQMDKPKDDFPSFIKRVRKALQRRPHKGLHRSHQINLEKLDYCSMCQNVQKIRNIWAHGGKLTISRIRDLLGKVNTLLCVFGLCHKQTAQAIKGIDVIDATQGLPEEKYWCLLQIEESDGIPLESSRCTNRMLRPRGKHFVGRVRELLHIKSVLTQHTSQGNQTVVIFGAAGVGKSYLATEVVHILAEIYKRQAWFNCADNRELQLDLTQSKCSKYNTVDDISSDVIFPKLNITQTTNTRTPSENEILFIYDNVCSSTMHNIKKRVMTSSSSSIITTRSTAVKQFLQQELPSVYTIHLRPFSSAESWNLFQQNIKVDNLETKTWILLHKTLNKVLRNLPLCVSIYSSLIKFTALKDCHSTPHKLQETLSSKEWSAIEERFVDCLHVRGFTGILQCAESYLQENPLVVLLLAKICVANSEFIPWNVISKAHTRVLCVQRFHVTGHNDLLLGLLRVTNWLFSDCGQDTLVRCRNSLEELGLINWEDSTSTVVLHMLTLEGVRDLLERRCLFLCDLLSKMPSYNCELSDCTTAISLHLSAELLLQTILSCAKILQEAVIITEENSSQEAAFSAFEFLANCVEKGALNILSEILAAKDIRAINSCLAEVLYLFQSSCHLGVAKQDIVCWIKLYQQFPFEQEHTRSRGLRLVCLAREAIEVYGKGKTGEAASKFETLLSEFVSFYGENSYMAAATHCLIATILEGVKGSVARKTYLARAALACSRLSTEPSNEDVYSAIHETMRANSYNRLNGMAGVKFFVWHSLAGFRAERFEEIDFEDWKAVFLMIILSQQRQQLAIKIITEQKGAEGKHDSKIILSCSSLIQESRSEIHLWNILQKRGRSLRVMVKTYSVFESEIFNVLISSTRGERLLGTFWSYLKDLIGDLCLALLQAGQLSVISRLLWRFIPGEQEHTMQKEQVIEGIPRCSAEDSYMFVQAEYLIKDDLLELTAIIKVFYELHILKESKNFETALTGLLAVLKQLLAMCSNNDKLFPGWDYDTLLHTAIGYVGCLSTILGRTRTQSSFKKLVSLSKSSAIPLEWRAALQDMVARVSTQWDQDNQSTIYDSFAQLQTDLVQGHFTHARSGALRCWKELAHVFEEVLTNGNDLKCKFPVVETFASMMLDLAQTLQQLYIKEGMLASARWFLTFRIQCSMELDFYLLAAKCRLNFVEFLKENGQLNEALEQCRIAEHHLEEELGDDYTDWLPFMPNVTMMRKDLEEEVREHENSIKIP